MGNNSWKRNPGPSEPLRTSAELAKEFGATTASLAGLMQADKNGPRPVFSQSPRATGGRSGYRNRYSWYRPSEVRKWWQKRQANNPQEK